MILPLKEYYCYLLTFQKECENFLARSMSNPSSFHCEKWHNVGPLSKNIYKTNKNSDKIVNLTQENSNNLWKPIYYCGHFLEWKKKSVINFYIVLLKKFWCQTTWVQPLILPFNSGILDRMSNNWLSLTAFPFYSHRVFWFVTFSDLQKLLMENECKIFMQLGQFNIF